MHPCQLDRPCDKRVLGQVRRELRVEMEQSARQPRLSILYNLSVRVPHQGNRDGIHSTREGLSARRVELDRLYNRGRQCSWLYTTQQRFKHESVSNNARIASLALHA